MTDIEERNSNNDLEEQFKIEDIEEIHKSMIDSLDKTNNLPKYQIENNPNYNYNSNAIIKINKQENKDYLIESNEILENTFEFNDFYNLEKESNNNENKSEGPINLIEFNRNNLVLNEKALNLLKSIKEDLIIVSIIGKARNGKSYLMNLLLNNEQSQYPGNGFEISSKLSSCTRGIWLWDTPRRKPNLSSKIIFIDSEGTSSIDLSTKTYDSKIFVLIVLISSLLFIIQIVILMNNL